jgi:hypothetical protein
MQKVKSLQVDHVQVEIASKGKEVAVRLNGMAGVGDKVYVFKETWK